MSMVNVWTYCGTIARYENGKLLEEREHSNVRSDCSEPLVLYTDYQALERELAAESATLQEEFRENHRRADKIVALRARVAELEKVALAVVENISGPQNCDMWDVCDRLQAVLGLGKETTGEPNAGAEPK
jgi:hypothetical protein